MSGFDCRRTEPGAGKTRIRLGHSPDADDAFMFYAIAKERIDTRGFSFEHVVEDIETLNRRALRAQLEVTAVSLHAYAHVSGRYAILTSGASIGFRYGPVVVSKEKMKPEELSQKKIAVPGEMTTAFLLLKLFEPGVRYEAVPFNEVLDAVRDGRADAALVIHEGQLTFEQDSFHKVMDLGEWWYEETSLPLPLGLDVVRKDLGPEAAGQIAGILKESIEYALMNRKDALEYALPFGRGIDPGVADRFVGMYVNERTVSMSPVDREAIEKLLTMAYERRLVPSRIVPEFIGPVQGQNIYKSNL